MKHWKLRYRLECPHFIDTCVDYWMSTTLITEETIQRHWNHIHPDYYKVSNVLCSEVEKSGTFKIVSRMTREGIEI